MTTDETDHPSDRDDALPFTISYTVEIDDDMPGFLSSTDGSGDAFDYHNDHAIDDIQRCWVPDSWGDADDDTDGDDTDMYDTYHGVPVLKSNELRQQEDTLDALKHAIETSASIADSCPDALYTNTNTDPDGTPAENILGATIYTDGGERSSPTYNDVLTAFTTAGGAIDDDDRVIVLTTQELADRLYTTPDDAREILDAMYGERIVGRVKLDANDLIGWYPRAVPVENADTDTDREIDRKRRRTRSTN